MCILWYIHVDNYDDMKIYKPYLKIITTVIKRYVLSDNAVIFIMK